MGNRFLELLRMASDAPRDIDGRSVVEIVGTIHTHMFYVFLN